MRMWVNWELSYTTSGRINWYNILRKISVSVYKPKYTDIL